MFAGMSPRAPPTMSRCGSARSSAARPSTPQEHGGYPHMMSKHLGLALTEEQRARWVTLDHPRRRRRRPAGRPRVPLGAAGLCRMGHAHRAGQLASPAQRPRPRPPSRTGAGARRPRISRKLPWAMQIRPFALERYFGEHEFSAPILLCASDVEPTRWPSARAGRRRDAGALGRAEPRLHRDGGPTRPARGDRRALPRARGRRRARLRGGRGGDLRLRHADAEPAATTRSWSPPPTVAARGGARGGRRR